MELKPIFEIETTNLSMNNNSIKKLENKVISDPSGIISNGIYKVINWENIRQNISLFLSILISITSIILIIIYATIYKTKWVGFIIPSIVLIGALWKTTSTFLEKQYLKRSVERYREDLKIGLVSTPPFIAKLYFKLYEKQITHNWITFVLMFYGSIFTVLLWWLKDFSWWIFEFDMWVKALFSNPKLMIWIFSITLIVVVFIHIILSIQRKKRILEIDSYFGVQIVPKSEIITLKNSKNKMYRRLFIISLMIIVVIPLFVKFILRIFRLKRK